MRQDLLLILALLTRCVSHHTWDAIEVKDDINLAAYSRILMFGFCAITDNYIWCYTIYCVFPQSPGVYHLLDRSKV